MSGSSTTVFDRRFQLDKFSAWILVMGLVFTVSALNAEDADPLEELDKVAVADEEEEGVSDKEEEAVSKSSNQDEPTVSPESTNDKTDLEKLIENEKKPKSKSQLISTELAKNSEVATGTFLPNGDSTLIGTVITGDAVRTWYEQVERDGRFR